MQKPQAMPTAEEMASEKWYGVPAVPRKELSNVEMHRRWRHRLRTVFGLTAGRSWWGLEPIDLCACGAKPYK